MVYQVLGSKQDLIKSTQQKTDEQIKYQAIALFKDNLLTKSKIY